MREMKNSGLDWIGKIPAHWEIKKGKYIFKIRNTKGNSIQLELLSPTQKFGVIPQSKYEELSTQVTVKVNEKTNLMSFKTIHKGDYCISLRSFEGGFEYSNYEGVVSPAYTVFYPTIKVDRCYYKYLFKIQSFIYEMNSYSLSLRDGKPISFDNFGNTYIPIPPVSEQKEIADYLDKKCGDIDVVCSDIQKQIDILEKYKRSIITEAVTKGLNPQVEMKDSGLDWIGKIPTHWDMYPIYFYFNEGKKQNKKNQENNLLSLSYGKIIKKDINTNGGLLPASFSTYNIVSKNDIIIRPTDLQNDKRSLRTGLVKEKGIITSAYIDLVPKEGVNSVFYHYLLHSYDIMKVFYNMGNGVRQGLNYNEFSKLILLSPPSIEQKEIADYLDKKCAEIESIIADKKSQLETMEKYKKSLIYEYVTGKKEVA